MDKLEFNNKLKDYASKLDININEEQSTLFYNYMNLLLEWNKNINLTAITEPNDIITKHFIDSITINKYIKNSNKLIDIGTGAGFPGIPLKIINKNINITLLDSLNKRIKFLSQVIKELKLDKIETIHGRAEDIAHNKEYREQYDIATSRAVAPLNVLLEYLIPFIKIEGKCICLKGPEVENEIKEAKNAMNILGCRIENIEQLTIPNTDIKRNIIIITKTKKTSEIYPRKAGTPSKKPLF